MSKILLLSILSLPVLVLVGPASWAGQNGAPPRELTTVASAVEVVQGLSAMPLKCIPPSLLRDAKGVAIFPHVFKAGLVIDKRFGRGVLLVRQPDSSWSDPVFVTVDGGGIGLQAGVESTDLVLVFKSARSLDRILKGKGKLTLGGDLSVAAGPVGREAEAATDGKLLADVFTYSRSRGLFAGLSLEGARVRVDVESNEAYYGFRGCRPQDVLTRHFMAVPVAEALKVELIRISNPPLPAPTVIIPPR